MDVTDLIIPRGSWNPRWDDGEADVGKAEDVSIHHSATKQLPATTTTAMEAAQMRLLEDIGHGRFSRPDFPRTGISYNVNIFPSGRAWQGVSFGRRGTHTDRRNSTVRSICFVGNYEIHEPTTAQLATARAIIAAGRGDTWERSAKVFGHRDIKSTACPGRNVYKHLAFLASGHDDVPTIPTKPKPKPERVSVNVTMPVIDLRNADRKPVRNRAVHLLQILLVFAGYSVGRAGIDGIGGSMTRNALGQFQRTTDTGGANGQPDFVVGEKSWKELIGGWNG